MRATTVSTPKWSRAMRAQRMLELSPLVTAARAPASSTPAARRSSRSWPSPATTLPENPSGRRRNWAGFLSMMATEWPIGSRAAARPEPTRPQPTTMTCTTPSNPSPGRGTSQPPGGSDSGAAPTAQRPDQHSVVSGDAVARGRQPEDEAMRPGSDYRGRGQYPRAVLTQGAPPQPLPPAAESDVPEGRLFRLKSTLLGRPLHTDQLVHERLGKPTALAVFASDNLSSSAYATEEILRVLIPYVGIAAFTLVMPITIAMLVVLAFLILSYRQTIKAYPFASGAYNVTSANFGPPVPQVAGAALLIDYVLTVAVSPAAGTAALTSAFSALRPYRIEIAIAFVLLIAYGNLRGLKESGRIFAVPTYFFMANMVLLLAVGLARWAFGDLPTEPLVGEGLVEIGEEGDGLLYGASLFVVLHAFASGGAAVTGV